MKKSAKRVFCIILAALAALSLQIAAFAQSAAPVLQFDENGTFTILHLTDWHTSYPMQAVQKQYAVEAIAASKPDLVVLGGDMSEADRDAQPMAVKEICDLFVQADVPFVITFGNHDYLHNMTIDELFALYKEYGGKYCLSVDEDPELFGCGTCSIPVRAHGSGKAAYCIYCFDSGCEVAGGYDSVHPDQIKWYQRKAEELKETNSGEYVPAVAFQHIIVQEIYDKIWPAAKAGDKKNVQRFDGKTYKMKAIPNLSSIKDGYIMEYPCPGYYNHGELSAMCANGDVRAIFCGHDHSNSFTVEIDGIDIVNTPSVKPHSLFKSINWGGRVITLHEDGAYESSVLAGYALAEKKDSGIVKTGALSVVKIAFVKVWKAFADASVVFWKPVTRLFYGF